MPFGLKNTPSEFQNIMNEIFTHFTHFSIVYIDDVLIFSSSIKQHWKHLNNFVQIIKKNGLVVSSQKIKLFQALKFFKIYYRPIKNKVKKVIFYGLIESWILFSKYNGPMK